ncbi:hypothetical protein IQ260_14100 [Leptolyngbya cf. ectocarpi LEGE 11479]|uniref:Uncharacterized protein n=1 Tax=Leptolyngbya cf. ectocarpi LEGE 11479 TaxID=1828722 RepID=A0A928ZUN8_LEPEC|nr:hypothetical protein [Leptolyngbya ectocarpi]MBE9067786.1 hypothetical protein [Leptolyngbya cf. ectocarpi LEGE 11479]
MKKKSIKLKANLKKLLRWPQRFYQSHNPANYHIHIGWFGGLCIYPKHPYSELQSHEYR